ncbi:MAG TPA: wax ester/triacylglycerol synthase family O-acyltransferase [Solirubrobacteraceae bacterium]|jgi:WS/DGAT/MGAT family acyltransferase
MHRMSPLDASFLHIEDDVTHMHIGSVALFEGPPPSHEEILDAIRAKLPLVPRYRQKVRFVPLSLGRPVWVDDAHFVLDYHVRHTALPAPGGDDELRNLAGRVMSQQLDRTKPLWEIWVAEGMEGGRWVLISKSHHCMVDGVSSTDLMSVLLDDAREPAPAPRDMWRPAPEPNAAQLVTQALGERAASPYEGVRTTLAALRGPRRVTRRAVEAARGLAATRSLLRPTPPTSLNGPIGPHRRWDWASGRLADVKTIRQALGGTVNDVVLTVITGGFRDLLQGRGEPVEDRFVRTLVPVSVRAQHERGTYNNKVSAMFAELPVGISDPVERLEAVRAQMQGLKESRQAIGGEVLTSLSGFAPAMLLDLAGRVATRVPQRNINTVTTNVPGPQNPLYFSGRRMLEAFPFVPLGGSVRVGVAIFSYDGALNYGVTGDYDAAPDIGVLCRGIERGLAELLAIAQGAGGPNGGRRAAAPKRAARPRAARSKPT